MAGVIDTRTAPRRTARLPFSSRRLGLRSAAWGGVAAAAMTAFYAAVLWSSAGFAHLVDQAVADRYWLLVIIPGFAVQVTLLAEVRTLHAAGMAAAGTGTAASATGMVACCLHHLAEVVPFVGLPGLAGLAAGWKPWLLSAGVLVTYGMIVRSWRHLARTVGEDPACHAR